MINFGALVAFTFVNLSVIAYFAIRRRQYRTLNHATRNIALPAIGMALTGVLWSFLHKDALIAGLVWSAIGLTYVYIRGRITGRRVTDVNLHDGRHRPTNPHAGTHPDTHSRTGTHTHAGTRAGHRITASAPQGGSSRITNHRDPAA
jgi:putrescine importer